jgi:hypothetical protein
MRHHFLPHTHDRTHKLTVRRTVHGTSRGISYLPTGGLSLDFASDQGRFLFTVALFIIFVLLPLHDSQAQTPPQFAPAPMAVSTSFDRRESVLERMRTFEGEMTREAVAALFMHMDPSFRQEPPVLLSDGTTTARVTIRVSVSKGELPKFAVSGGHCVSARTSDNGGWILEILPDRGSMAASVTVLSGVSMIEYPLTVAPPLPLLDPQKAEVVEIEYAVFANELAEGRNFPAH